MMPIETGSTVHCAYVLTLSDGTQVDVATEEEPFRFVVGQQDVFPAFEEAFLGREPGECFGFEVSPEDGYGLRDPKLVQEFPRVAFGDDAQLEIGEQYVAETEDGMPVSFRVESVDDDVIKADFNHPLAGKKLSFQVEVLDVK